MSDGRRRWAARLAAIAAATLLFPGAVWSQGDGDLGLPGLTAAQLGEGWQVLDDRVPTDEERGEDFPWSEAVRLTRFGGPGAARVLLVAARVEPGGKDRVDAAEYTHGVIEGVGTGTDRGGGDYRLPGVLSGLPFPAGCSAAARAEGDDPIMGYPTGATSCISEARDVIVAIVSGGLGVAGRPAPVSGAEASDLVIAAALRGVSVADVAGATPGATPVGSRATTGGEG